MPKIEALKIGPAVDRASDMGPLVTAQHLAKVKGYVDQGEKEGAKLVLDGRGFKAPQGYEDGYFIGGTLFDNVTTDMTIWKEEIFGPVLSVARAANYAEAVEMVG
ncbi:MAG TPA: aldehyde dehydrogenase family protein, partial [Amaricoccus sp.]|nr:aldehyde dehydrogenase family protein [Amaricoccus sp.]